MRNGDWGLGIGDWGMGIGDWVLRTAGLDGLNHGDAAHGGGGEFGGVPLLHPGDVHPLGGDEGGYRQVQHDGSHADGCQEGTVMDHDHQVEDHHARLDGQGREGLHLGAGNGGVGGSISTTGNSHSTSNANGGKSGASGSPGQ